MSEPAGLVLNEGVGGTPIPLELAPLVQMVEEQAATIHALQALLLRAMQRTQHAFDCTSEHGRFRARCDCGIRELQDEVAVQTPGGV